MVVQHNLKAMNSNRMLSITQGTLSKSTEKLSSGYKINRAADDAAGLSISEKMRKQIRGLTQASANAEDGISAVQTAEGALTEVHDMLQRMNELAVKSANETNSEADRSYIQSEVDQLVNEIDRVSTTTKFNEIYLLKGKNADGKAGKITYNTAKDKIKATFASSGSFNEVKGNISQTATLITAPTTYGGQQFTFKDGTTTKNYILVETGKASSVDQAVAKLNQKANTKAFSNIDDLIAAARKDLDKGGNVKSVDVSQVDTTTPGASAQIKLTFNAFADLNNGNDISLHVGADSSDDNKITMNINQMSARGLGINGIRVDGEYDDNATKAIDTIAAAIQKVSTQRSSLGAIQNRLEHTIKNLDNIVENTTAAESLIRDTDMASQMVAHSNANILAQAGQSMLAQSNQSNQGVLSLLG